MWIQTADSNTQNWLHTFFVSFILFNILIILKMKKKNETLFCACSLHCCYGKSLPSAHMVNGNDKFAPRTGSSWTEDSRSGWMAFFFLLMCSSFPHFNDTYGTLRFCFLFFLRSDECPCTDLYPKFPSKMGFLLVIHCRFYNWISLFCVCQWNANAEALSWRSHN